jgi:hypothetical protein
MPGLAWQVIAVTVSKVGRVVTRGLPTLFDTRLDTFLYSLLRSCFACDPIRTRSPTFLMPMSLSCVWSISMRFSPLM